MPTEFDDALDHFKQLYEEMTLDQIHSSFFDSNVTRSTLKAYLNGNVPKRGPRQETSSAFVRAFKASQARQHDQFRLYHALCVSVGRSPEKTPEFDNYLGNYWFWRIPRDGPMIKGELKLFIHPQAGIPFHSQEHHQDVSGNRMTFRYSGPVVFMAQNFYLLAYARSGVRQTILERVNVPEHEFLSGMFISEEHDSKKPFAAKIVALRQRAGRQEPTQTYLQNMLRTGRTTRFSLRM